MMALVVASASLPCWFPVLTVILLLSGWRQQQQQNRTSLSSWPSLSCHLKREIKLNTTSGWRQALTVPSTLLRTSSPSKRVLRVLSLLNLITFSGSVLAATNATLILTAMVAVSTAQLSHPTMQLRVVRLFLKTWDKSVCTKTLWIRAMSICGSITSRECTQLVTLPSMKTAPSMLTSTWISISTRLKSVLWIASVSLRRDGLAPLALILSLMLKSPTGRNSELIFTLRSSLTRRPTVVKLNHCQYLMRSVPHSRTPQISASRPCTKNPKSQHKPSSTWVSRMTSWQLAKSWCLWPV